MNKLKYLPKICKRDKTEVVNIQYAVVINDEAPVYFDTKLQLFEYIGSYRSSKNEIHSLDMFKVVTYSLLK